MNATLIPNNENQSNDLNSSSFNSEELIKLKIKSDTSSSSSSSTSSENESNDESKLIKNRRSSVSSSSVTSASSHNNDNTSTATSSTNNVVMYDEQAGLNSNKLHLTDSDSDMNEADIEYKSDQENNVTGWLNNSLNKSSGENLDPIDLSKAKANLANNNPNRKYKTKSKSLISLSNGMENIDNDLNALNNSNGTNTSANNTFHMCKDCFRTFKDVNNYKEHRFQEHHITEFPNIRQCKMCSYATLLKSKFDCHMRCHLNNKVIRCQRCNYSTINIRHMSRHERMHMISSGVINNQLDTDVKTNEEAASVAAAVNSLNTSDFTIKKNKLKIKNLKQIIYKNSADLLSKDSIECLNKKRKVIQTQDNGDELSSSEEMIQYHNLEANIPVNMAKSLQEAQNDNQENKSLIDNFLINSLSQLDELKKRRSFIADNRDKSISNSSTNSSSKSRIFVETNDYKSIVNSVSMSPQVNKANKYSSSSASNLIKDGYFNTKKFSNFSKKSTEMTTSTSSTSSTSSSTNEFSNHLHHHLLHHHHQSNIIISPPSSASSTSSLASSPTERLVSTDLPKSLSSSSSSSPSASSPASSSSANATSTFHNILNLVNHSSANTNSIPSNIFNTNSILASPMSSSNSSSSPSSSSPSSSNATSVSGVANNTHNLNSHLHHILPTSTFEATYRSNLEEFLKFQFSNSKFNDLNNASSVFYSLLSNELNKFPMDYLASLNNQFALPRFNQHDFLQAASTVAKNDKSFFINQMLDTTKSNTNNTSSSTKTSKLEDVADSSKYCNGSNGDSILCKHKIELVYLRRNVYKFLNNLMPYVTLTSGLDINLIDNSTQIDQMIDSLVNQFNNNNINSSP